jgi:cobalamin biosynthesis protein CobT
MSEKKKPTHTSPGGKIADQGMEDDGVVNDSLGTTDMADSTGSDEEKETGDAKKNNRPTRED